MSVCRSPSCLYRSLSVAQRLSRPRHVSLPGTRRPVSSLGRLVRAVQNLFASVSRPDNASADHPPASARLVLPPPNTKPLAITPRVYDHKQSSWTPVVHRTPTQPFARGTAVELVSWPLGFHTHARFVVAHTFAVMQHLKRHFTGHPKHAVIMLQQITKASLEIIKADEWVQKHFLLSHLDPQKAQESFCLTMISKALPIANSSVVLFDRQAGYSALVVDILVLADRGSGDVPELFRLCNMYLADGRGPTLPQRLGRLAFVSRLLKGTEAATGTNIVGAVAGGRVAPYDGKEDLYHKAPEVDLEDVWYDNPTSTPPMSEIQPKYPKRCHFTFYNDPKSKFLRVCRGMRASKFLYTGSVETFAAYRKEQTAVEKLGLYSVRVETKLSPWKLQGRGVNRVSSSRPGSQRLRTMYIDEAEAAILQKRGLPPGQTLTRVEQNVYSGESLGISLGVRIPKERTTIKFLGNS